MGRSTEQKRKHDSNLRATQKALKDSKKGQFCEWPDCNNPGEVWHHLDPTTKLFTISKALGKCSVGQFKTELDKCKWVCWGHDKYDEGCFWLGLPRPWDANGS